MKWLEATEADLLAAHERAFDRDEAALECPDPDDWDEIPLPDEPPDDWGPEP